MTILFLIAHKVRGEPAFDIAEKIKCPICEPMRQGLDEGTSYSGCKECDDEQHWWIIPTSGHRAFPYWSARLEDIDDTYELKLDRTQEDVNTKWALFGPSPMPPDLPDHYQTKALVDRHDAKAFGKKATGPSKLLADLGLVKKAPPVNRRGL